MSRPVPARVPLALAPVLTFAAATAVGCSGGHHDDHHTPEFGPGVVASGTIDAGARFEELFPGRGVGVFIEAMSPQAGSPAPGGGDADARWSVALACDSLLSGYGCTWDLLLTGTAVEALTDVEGFDLETEDDFFHEADGSIRFLSLNGETLDGITFSAPPGDPVRFDVLLDGYPGHRYVFWHDGGAVQAGAPTNPIDLTPR